MELRQIVGGIGILSLLVLIPLALVSGTAGFIPELLIFAAITGILYLCFDTLRLNVPVYTLVILSMLLHGFGVLGFYGQSPLPVAWDHVTHFALFSWGLMFFRFFEQWMDVRFFSKRTILLLCAVFLAASGVGAVIELSEFLGYLQQGFGEGAFAFGPGDGVGTDGDVIANLGGGWINTGWDLIFNTAGILLAMFICVVIRLATHKPIPAYYFEDVGDWSRKIN
ncbi:hypothetical protein J4219_06835 [Candidatus Woesearchaeota archaeon]|nr:hypothetical protein [Candidatus Woesearchaeota archaeon]